MNMPVKGHTSNPEIMRCLEPHYDRPPVMDFVSFSKADAWDILVIAHHLPDLLEMSEDDNGFPLPWKVCVDIAKREPTTRFGGYCVFEGRLDERIAVSCIQFPAWNMARIATLMHHHGTHFYSIPIENQKPDTLSDTFWGSMFQAEWN